MISQQQFLSNGNNKVQPQSSFNFQPQGNNIPTDQDISAYISLLQASILQAQQQQAQQQLLSLYQTQLSSNTLNQNNLYNQLNLSNGGSSLPQLMDNKSFLQNQSFNSNFNNNRIPLGGNVQYNNTQQVQYYQSQKPQFEGQNQLLNNYQLMSQIGATSNATNQLNGFGAYPYTMGNNASADQKIASNLAVNTPHSLLNQEQNISQQKNVQYQNLIGISHPMMQQSRNETQSYNQQNPAPITKKIKKNCSNCQNCIKKEQVALKKVSSCSSSSSSETTNPIYECHEKLSNQQPSKVSKKSNTSKSSGKQKISRLEETRAERWSFMKKFYNKQILINRVFIDLEDENLIIPTSSIAEPIVKKEDEENSASSFTEESKDGSNKNMNECSNSVISQSQTLANGPQAEKSNLKYSGYLSSQESSASLDSSTNL